MSTHELLKMDSTGSQIRAERTNERGSKYVDFYLGSEAGVAEPINLESASGEWG